MSTLDRLFGESNGLAEYAGRYALYLGKLLADLDCEAIGRVGQTLERARAAGRTIFILGNGGSAATSTHLANDLGFGPRVKGGEAYRAISLADNLAVITAAGNDIGYESVFTEQLKTLMHPGDVIVAISASGNSPNVVRAVEYAKAHGAYTIALTGFDGGIVRKIAHDGIHVATRAGDYGPVEDIHLILGHLVTSYLTRWTASAARKESSAIPGDSNGTFRRHSG